MAWKMRNAGTGDTVGCVYDVHYQTYKGKGKAKKLSAVLNNLMNSAITTDTGYSNMSIDERVKQDAMGFYQEWQSLNSDSSSEWSYKYLKEQTFRILHANKGFISLRDDANYFTGGAHNIGVTVFSVIRLKDNKAVESWKELFKDPEAVLKIAEATFRKDKAIQDVILTGQDWFYGEKFYLPDNFAFTDEGIQFVYNMYEIAKGSEGATYLTLTYKQLENLFSVEF